MRVLIINTSERTGGAAVAANRLMEALNNNGVKAKMLVRDKGTANLTVCALPQTWRLNWHFLWERLCIWFHLRLKRDHLFDIDIANCGTDITNPVFNGVTPTMASNDFTSTDGKVRFIGTYELISFDAEDKSILFMGPTNTLSFPLDGAKIGAFRGYFQYADDNQVNEFVLNFGGEDPDGIVSMEDVRGKMSDVWYSLDGRKLDNSKFKIQNSKLPSGIYIQNGKKVVVK